MKLTPVLRFALASFAIATTLILIANSREVENVTKKVHRTNGKVIRGESSNISNTDYIFFESISKYLFVNL